MIISETVTVVKFEFFVPLEQICVSVLEDLDSDLKEGSSIIDGPSARIFLNAVFFRFHELRYIIATRYQLSFFAISRITDIVTS